jgi:hypothetical protein
MKELASYPFFNNTLITVSKCGSMHLFKNVNMSLIVRRAIFDNEDLGESAILMRLPIKEWRIAP